MKQKKRSYLDMQLEEATLESGRYNADYDLSHNPPPAGMPLLDAYRTAMVSLGLPLGAKTKDQGSAKASKNN